MAGGRGEGVVPDTPSEDARVGVMVAMGRRRQVRGAIRLGQHEPLLHYIFKLIHNSRCINIFKFKMSFFICGGTNYREDVNVGQFSFLPVEFKLGTSTITLLDSNGAFLEE